MKKVLPVLAVVAVVAAVIAILAFRSGASREEAVTAGLSGDKVEVLYFHLTRRCVTCQAVENVSGEAVKELYPAEVGKGTVVFRTLNIEDKSSEADAARVKATGQEEGFPQRAGVYTGKGDYLCWYCAHHFFRSQPDGYLRLVSAMG